MGAASNQIATASSSGVLSLIDAITFTTSPARWLPRSMKTSMTAAASTYSPIWAGEGEGWGSTKGGSNSSQQLLAPTQPGVDVLSWLVK